MNLERQIDRWFNKLEKGILTESDKSESLQVKLSAIARSIDVAIFPFMVATHFKYKNLFEVKNDFENEWYLNKEQYKTTKELVNIYLFDRMLRNSEYQKPNTIITSLNTLLFGNNLEFQNKINSKMHDIWHKRDSYGPYEVLKHLKDSLTDYEKKQQGGVVTPIGLAEKMISQINIKDGNKVLDSACGHGTFLLVAHEQNPKAKYFGIDISPQRCYIAKYVVPFAEIRCVDFLEGDCMKKIDLIVGNPPFNGINADGKKRKYVWLDIMKSVMVNTSPDVCFMVLPSLVLRSKKRNILKSEYDIVNVWNNVDSYFDINVPVCVVKFVKKSLNNNRGILIRDKNGNTVSINSSENVHYIPTHTVDKIKILMKLYAKSIDIVGSNVKKLKINQVEWDKPKLIFPDANQIGLNMVMFDTGENKEKFICKEVIVRYFDDINPEFVRSQFDSEFFKNVLAMMVEGNAFLTSHYVYRYPIFEHCSWSESSFYKYLGLSQEEIDIIERKVK